jgi:hypothetical protein
MSSVIEADMLHCHGRQPGYIRHGENRAALSGSETVARCQKERIGTREAHGIPWTRVGGDKPINGEESPRMSWESDQFIIAMKPRNGGGAKELAVRPRGEGYIHQTSRWVLDANGTCSITSVEPREVWLKSRMREICTSGSVRGFIVDSQRRWL